MPTPDPTTTTTGTATGNTPDAPAPAWLSARDAAAALGVSEKTVWRRAKAGTLTARKVASERGGEVWEIALEPTGQKRPAKPTDRPDKVKQSPESEREPTGQRPAKPTGQNSDGEADTGARFMAHLEAENKFLRVALEQRDRDAAELRAALRAALKLTAGETTPQLTAKPETAPFVAGDAPKGFPSAPQTKRAASNGAGAALTYGDIADALERDLEAHGL
jgi:hypothetical protein